MTRAREHIADDHACAEAKYAGSKAIVSVVIVLVVMVMMVAVVTVVMTTAARTRIGADGCDSEHAPDGEGSDCGSGDFLQSGH